MARIFPFQPYRYSPAAGRIEDLVTQPYDKISPSMQARYLALSPYNLVRIILGERFPEDDENENAYTRAAGYFEDWIAKGILKQESAPNLYAYFQEFESPDTGERLERKGFIGLGALEDYSAGVVHRHEQTLSGPKKGRRDLLERTHAHFGQIFMLYPDPDLAVDGLLDQVAKNPPDVEIKDEYGATHRLWSIADPTRIATIQRLMSDKKLLIADGHHRYETALGFSRDHPEIPGAQSVMMTFVNMHSPGLNILATHRLVSGLADFDGQAFIEKAGGRRLGSVSELRAVFAQPAPDKIRIGFVLPGADAVYLIERDRKPDELDVQVLHRDLLAKLLGISEEAVREEKNLQYARGIDPAVDAVRNGAAQVAFLLEPTTVEQVAAIAFSGGVMPQKSTDFYPKLLSGLTIYKID